MLYIRSIKVEGERMEGVFKISETLFFTLNIIFKKGRCLILVLRCDSIYIKPQVDLSRISIEMLITEFGYIKIT
jgi:hypothetical protein